MDNSIIILLSSGLSMACLLLCTERHTAGRVCAVADDLTLSIETGYGRIRRVRPHSATDNAVPPDVARRVQSALLGQHVRCTHSVFASRAGVIVARVCVTQDDVPQGLEYDFEAFLLAHVSGQTA